MGNLEVHGGDQLDPCDLGDDVEDFGVLPCIIDERSMSVWICVSVNHKKAYSWRLPHVILLVHEASELAVCEVAGETVVIYDLLAQNLVSDAHHGLLGEERKRFGHGNGRDAVHFAKAKLFHCLCLGGARVPQVLAGAERLLGEHLLLHRGHAGLDEWCCRPAHARLIADVRRQNFCSCHFGCVMCCVCEKGVRRGG